MKMYEPFYNDSQSMLKTLTQIINNTNKITNSDFRTVKSVELIKQALNNALVETIVLSDLLYQLSIIENDNELEIFLDLVEVDNERD